MDKRKKFFFDDEPLKDILYGKKGFGATLANKFLKASEYLEKINSPECRGNKPKTIKYLKDLSDKGHPISVGLCRELTTVLNSIIPIYPRPKNYKDFSGIGPLVKKMWDVAVRSGDRYLQKNLAPSVYRWYEAFGYFSNSRLDLMRLLHFAQEDNYIFSEAIWTNNLAFDFLSDGNYMEAIPLFERAAEIFDENSFRGEYANSRANYWMCFFEPKEFDKDKIEEIETELKEIIKDIDHKSIWHRRKPFIIKAKVEEQRGHIRRAIKFAQRAVFVCKYSNTQYPELDRKYIQQLQEKNKKKNS
jgi:tetratricopeptide (TPR) repeat protein